MMHFAHFEKRAEHIEGARYLLRLKYDMRDETEIVIRVLSFGPMVRAVAPQTFVDLIKERLIMQKKLWE
jgi:predicted DNA-binding transcriptional regulator YafY